MSLSVPENARLEIKFVSHAANFDTLMSWIHLHPSGFYPPFPDRQVNNVYFDGYNYAAFTENLSGASERNKVRYRWYGPSIEPCAGTLEIKRKRNYFGWKLRYCVEITPYSPEMSWRSIRNKIRDQISEPGRIWLDSNPLPILLNRYRRRYFISRDGKIRVTIDNNQAVWGQRFRSKPNFTHKANLPDALVVEIKFARKDREYASQTIQGLPLRVSRHSKYMIGVNTISGNS